MEKEKKKVSSIKGKSRKKKWNNKFFISLFLFIAVFVFITMYFTLTKNHVSNVKNIRISSSDLGGSGINYKKLSDGYVRITNDGIIYFDKSGSIKWNVSYNIKKFLIDSKADYIAIAGVGERKVYVFNDKGKTIEYEVKPNEAIEKIAVSNDGELALLISDDKNEYLKKFSDGGLKDITDAINLEKQVATDIQINEDGKYISMSYLYKDNEYDDRLLSRVSLYYFDDTYALINGVRYIMSIDANTGIDKVDMLIKIKFVGADTLYLVTDNKLYLTKIEDNKLVINKKITLNNEIKSIYANNEYFAMILDNINYDKDNKRNIIEVYDKNGRKKMNKKIDVSFYDDFYLTRDNVVIKSGDDISIYGFLGNRIFYKNFDTDIIYVEKIKSIPLMEYYMATNNMFRRVIIY